MLFPLSVLESQSGVVGQDDEELRVVQSSAREDVGFGFDNGFRFLLRFDFRNLRHLRGLHRRSRFRFDDGRRLLLRLFDFRVFRLLRHFFDDDDFGLLSVCLPDEPTGGSKERTSDDDGRPVGLAAAAREDGRRLLR